jgi:hypothetical protein
MTIRAAMVADAKRFPRLSSSENFIFWGGREIRTSILLRPTWKEGFVKLTFLKRKGATKQGADIKVDDGLLHSLEGLSFKTLRTWNDDEYVDNVEYRYLSETKSIFVWNVYVVDYGKDRLIEEKWTENAGFWVEHIEPSSYILHCSSGPMPVPDFESLVIRIDFRPLKAS